MKKKTALYQSLYEKLKAQIIEGHYQANEKFPSKRQLSEHLSLSHTTIEHAYQLLLDEGFIYAKPRSGYYVSDIESLPVVPQTSGFHEINFIQKSTPKSHYRYAFNLAEIDAENFPLHTLRKYARDVFDDSNIDLYNMDIHRVNWH